MSQEQVQRPGGDDSQDSVGGTGSGQEQIQQTVNEADSLLDEIDGILETNAEEFVKAYIQKGGQ